ncbi:MAG: thioredoxin-dependent thiol peroxidase [Chloroflexi bacterium]|nr:MAG: thioredoxin-dependent thiol peroxidase [Chloroflexota bacterium]MBL1194200.1 thioredoxin-dependent thiol peroxidase [Chloroflexota bacterium]NOH11493.1 thioredoxin-dependent thiol peroxidase [Chloroflexota bacterium]
MILQVGADAPDFELLDENETPRKLADYRGKPVVLYFYPKDDTPGCTKEACNFRDDYSAYQQVGVEILGVSPDTPKSHTKFKQKFDLPFPLLADTEKEVLNAYGAWGKKKSFGREYDGVLRTTYVIDGEGKIAKVFEKVRPAQHSEAVLDVIKDL